MPLYHYRAMDHLGDEITGEYEGPDRAAVICQLMERRLNPLEVKRAKGRGRSPLVTGILKRVGPKDLAVFCRQFAAAVNVGVPLLYCLDILAQQTASTRLKKALNQVYGQVQRGNTLSRSMAMHRNIFPELFVNTVEMGENSGTLGNALDRMAVHYEKEYRIKQKMRDSMVYPTAVGIVAVIVIIFLVTAVLPAFASIFMQMGAALPASTRMLIAVSGLVRRYWLLISVLIFGTVSGLRAFQKTRTGREYLDGVKLKLPLVGTVMVKVASARFARSLGTLIYSGVPLLDGVKITKKTMDNSVIYKGLLAVEDGLKKGRGLAGPLEGMGIFSPMLVHMVRVGEQTGTLETILGKAADFLEQEVESAVTRATTLIEPFIIIIMAAVVAFIVLSTVVPMFNLMGYTGF